MKFRYLASTILSVAVAASAALANNGEAPQQKSMAPFVKKHARKIQMASAPAPTPLLVPQSSATRRTSISGRNYFGAEVGLTSGAFDGGPISFTGINQYNQNAEISTVLIDKHSPAFGFSLGGVLDLAMSDIFGVQAKVGYRSVASSGERSYEIDCADPQGNVGIAALTDKYTSSVGYLGVDLLARIQFTPDGIYGLAGLGFSSVLSANADFTKTITSSENDCQWLDENGLQTGEYVNESGGEFKENLNPTRFDARLGVGTWIPVGDNGMVIVPELTIGYPITRMVDDTLADAYDELGLNIPNLIYANFTIGIKFPWGDNGTSSSTASYDNSSSSSSSSTQSVEAGKAMLSGRVVDNAGNPIDDAQVTVVDLNNNQVVATDKTDEGMYNVKVNAPGRYSVSADAPGYLFGSALYEVDKDGRILKSSGDIKLSPSTDGRVRLLVFFDFDKATLQPASYPELNRAVALMKANPIMRVEIAGFTDAQGTDSYNKDLSQRRANAVREYLVRQGVEASRLTAVGYGEENPVASNDTEEGRADNRRVEFVVIKR
jgi:outer membrane protein OmpA-like peptidoglycan-associated protein